MKFLITGNAGFIGMHVTRRLLAAGHHVCGVDNINDYYSPELKKARLLNSGFDVAALKYGGRVQCAAGDGEFILGDISDRKVMEELFAAQEFDVVVNLAAQAGVRYSLVNPHAYIDSNVTGFLNILEGCRHHGVRHLVYASSSSVYGGNRESPFATSQPTDTPLSLYAATKKANELMAHSYGELYGLCSTGLRFFSAYGPWGRPDMALFQFTEAILAGKPIQVFNNGEMLRDFTYIDDIVEGISRIVTGVRPAAAPTSALYNIGRGAPVKLMAFISALEAALGVKAKMEMLPMQPGDVPATWADTVPLQRDYAYTPATDVETGIREFVNWYKTYHKC